MMKIHLSPMGDESAVKLVATLLLCGVAVPGVALESIPSAPEASDGIPLERMESPLPEYGPVQGPDGWCWSRSSAAFGSSGSEKILCWQDGLGQAIVPAWTDGRYNEGDPYFSPDGQAVCFVSDRPAADDPQSGDLDIWCAQRVGDAWQQAERLPEPVNSAGREYSPVLTRDGELWFASDRPGGQGMGDLYRASENTDGAWVVVNLGRPVNSAWGEWNMELSSDGEFLVFEASHRSENRSVSGDLYIAQWQDGAWGPAIPLASLNSHDSDLMPRWHGSRLVWSQNQDGDAVLRSADMQDWIPRPPSVWAVSRSAHELLELSPDTLDVLRRIPLGTGSHELELSADGRQAISASYGFFPRPHKQPIEPAQLEWEQAPSEGLLLHSLAVPGQPRQIAIRDCLRPHGLAMTPQGEAAWITCEDSGALVQFSPADGVEQQRWVLDPGVHKVMHLPASGQLVASNPDNGAVYLLQPGSTEVTTLATGKGAEALAAAADGSQVFVANSFDRTVCEIGLPAGELGHCWDSGGSFPIALGVNSTRGELWVANSASSNVTVLSLADGRLTNTVALSSPPLGMALDQSGQRIYVSLPRENAIVMLDARDGRELARAVQVMEVDDIDLAPRALFASPPDT